MPKFEPPTFEPTKGKRSLIIDALTNLATTAQCETKRLCNGNIHNIRDMGDGFSLACDVICRLRGVGEGVKTSKIVLRNMRTESKIIIKFGPKIPK